MIKIGTKTNCIKCGKSIVTTRKGQMLCDSCQNKLIKKLKSDTDSIKQNIKKVKKSSHDKKVKALIDELKENIRGISIKSTNSLSDILINDFLHIDVRDGFICSPDIDSSIGIEDSYNKAVEMKANKKEYMQIFDWMPLNNVVDMIKSKLSKCTRVFYARKTIAREISQRDANRFLKLYHMQGAATKQTYCVGLFDKKTDELLQVQTFGAARFNKNFEWEAIRLASKFDTVIIGGVSKGFAKFVKEKDPINVLSYVDASRSQGETDEKTGLTYIGHSGVQPIWVNVLDNENPKYIKQMSLRFQGIARLLGKKDEDFPDYQKEEKFTSNDSLMLANGYLRVYDAGSFMYEYKRG